MRRRVGFLLASIAVICVVAGCTEDRRFPPPGSPNLVLISLDTLRADHLGCYGYERATSPNIDAFAARATLFETAMATAPKTSISHMSMFTSLYPPVHGVGQLPDEALRTGVAILSPKIRTLADILYERGYATVGYHGGGFMRPQFGFGRGFEIYEEGSSSDAIAWLEKKAGSRPFFLLFHTYEVHDPYTPEPPYDTMFGADYDGRIVHDRRKLKTMVGSKEWANYAALFWDLVDRDDPRDVEQLIDLYDGEIAHLDVSLAALFDTIDRLAPDTVVVIVSDHGEQFGEHGDFTHTHVYRELMHVPFLIRSPRQERGERVTRPVSMIDLAPTLLELLGVEPLEQFQGRSLVPLLEAARSGRDAVAGALGERTELFGILPSARLVTVRDDAWRLVSTQAGFELYDIIVDPKETRNLLRGPEASAPRTLAAFERLQAALEHWQQANQVLRSRYEGAGQAEPLDDETVKQLRALGYLN